MHKMSVKKIACSWCNQCAVFALLFNVITLSACGSSDDAAFVSNVAGLTSVQEAGALQGVSSAIRSSKTTIQNQVNQFLPAGSDVNRFIAEYDVDTYRIDYLTEHTDGRLVNVSGLIAVPVKGASRLSPILSFQHGTLFHNNEAPSSQRTLVGNRNPEIILASLGYIVFSPDYIGYGRSFGEKHPYLQRKTSANTTINMLKAGKNWLARNAIIDNGQLFMTGYSQGGYVTMAAHRAIQEQDIEGLNVTAVVMGAGPYDLTTAIETLVPLDGAVSLIRFLSDNDIERIVNQAIVQFTPVDSDIVFDPAFIRRFIDNDQQDNVHEWLPLIPMKLFHGQEDQTVPIVSAENTRDAMLLRGADVDLVICDAVPSSHLGCVFPYIEFMIRYFEQF
jgi:pimeloyl-ACP methyl ester carboxylesterase